MLGQNSDDEIREYGGDHITSNQQAVYRAREPLRLHQTDPQERFDKASRPSGRAAISNANYLSWRIEQLDGEQ